MAIIEIKLDSLTGAEWDTATEDLMAYGDKISIHFQKAYGELVMPDRLNDTKALAECVKYATSQALYASAILEQLQHVQISVRSSHSIVRDAWEQTYAQEQQSDQYRRKILSSHSWQERENFAKINHLHDWQVVMAADRTLQTLFDLIEQVKEFLRFVYQYQRSLSDISRLIHTQSILDT